MRAQKTEIVKGIQFAKAVFVLGLQMGRLAPPTRNAFLALHVRTAFAQQQIQPAALAALTAAET
jgi:hypothetical protein